MNAKKEGWEEDKKAEGYHPLKLSIYLLNRERLWVGGLYVSYLPTLFALALCFRFQGLGWEYTHLAGRLDMELDRTLFLRFISLYSRESVRDYVIKASKQASNQTCICGENICDLWHWCFSFSILS